MYKPCGISFDDGVTLTELKSVAVSTVNPILDSDGLSVISDNGKPKSGRITGATPSSSLAINRQCEMRLSIINSDLGVLRLLERSQGATPITINVGRVDLFANGQYNTPHVVVILGVNSVKRISASYYECVLKVVKV